MVNIRFFINLIFLTSAKSVKILTMKRLYIYILFVFACIYSSNAEYWQKMNNLPSGFENNYYLDVYFLPSNPNYGWVCGFNSKVLRTSDRGLTWQGTTVSGTSFHLESIHFVNQNVGYCSGVEGIFKSTDGGATWREISDPSMGYLWGCYFYNENIGIVVGEGCLDNIQKFWRTENGGATWTLTTTNEFNSGMTDLILYDPNGLGYAVGSGKLYVTYNGGRRWEKYRDTEYDNGDNRWQEEITKVGASFLLPVSGTSFDGSSCQGGGMGGAIYFTTDSGDTWNKSQTMGPMYGTFLLDTNRGWACGYYGMVYYTEDAGRNWYLRNCGVFDNDLDDIWFINESEAWVVGRGVWKLSTDAFAFMPENLYFKGVCFPEEKIDSIIFTNQSFNISSVKFSIVDDTSGSFSILYPPSDNTIILQPCGSIKLKIKFNPNSQGHKAAQLKALANDTSEIYAKLEGFSSKSSMQLSGTTVNFDTIYANTLHNKAISFTAQNPGEFVAYINPDTLVKPISTNFSKPVEVTTTPYNMEFLVKSADTGYIEKDYKIGILPCSRDTIISVSAYIKSSIINASDTTLFFNCPPIKNNIISIPVSNSGNADLIIDQVNISNGRGVFSGYSSGKGMPAVLKPKEQDSLNIGLYLNPALDRDTLLISIINNDSTRYYNYAPPPMLDSVNILPKNPYTVKVIINNLYSQINLQKRDTVNYKLCFGDSVITTFKVKNISHSLGNYFYSVDTVNCNFKTIHKIDKEFSINALEEQTYTLFIYPKNPGKFSLKLKFKSANCDDVDSALYEGTAENISVIPTPSNISIVKKTKISDTVYVKINSSGIGNMILDSIKTIKNIADYSINFDYTGNLVFIDSASNVFQFIINTDKDGIYRDTLYFYFSGACNRTVKIPINVRSTSSELIFENLIKFKDIICDVKPENSTLKIKNIGTEAEIIQNIDITNPAFVLIENSFPVTVAPNEQKIFNISFTPSDTGYTYATAKIYSNNLAGNFVNVDLQGFFGKTDTKLSKNFVDLDSIEYCYPAIYDTLQIKNEGNIPAQVSINLGNMAGLSAEKDKLTVEAFSSEELILKIIPSEIIQKGFISHTVKIIDNTCPNINDYNIKLFKIYKELDLKPNQIKFSNLWANIISRDSSQVINKSNVPIVIKSINLTGTGSNYISTSGLNIGDILATDEARKIYFSLQANEFTDINADMNVSYVSECDNSAAVHIQGNVPEEIYKIKIFSEKYRKMPNEKFSVNIICNDTIPSYVPVDSIRFSLIYDRDLLSSEQVIYNAENIDFKSRYPDLSFIIRGNDAKNFLTGKNQSVSVLSTAMLSIPDTSTLNISGTQIFSKKKFDVEYENGFLTIYNYCAPVAEFSNFEFITANAKISAGNTGKIYIDYSSSKGIIMEYQLADELGRIHETGTLQPNLTGKKTIESNAPNGLYFVTVKLYNRIIAQKLVILGR